MKQRFNIRVYGILCDGDSVLICEENRFDLHFYKFPGGGLEFGEGLRDCLKRECMEELGTEVEIRDHYYTTDFFQASAFDREQQLISIYFRIGMRNAGARELTSPEPEIRLHWIPLRELKEDLFMFPVDKRVAWMLTQAGG